MHLSPRTPVLGATDFAVIAAAAVSTSSASPLSVAFTTSAAATDLDALTTIRRQALASDAPLSELCRYLEALSAAADKLPPVLARAVPFTWASSATVTSTSPQSAFTSFDLEFEKASVLFNIATSLRTSAFAEHAVDHKSACNTLCMAAAAFRQAHELGFVCSTACVDFASATCSALESVCVAEAQERFVKKAEADKLSIATLAKLAFGAARLYVGAHSVASEAAVFPNLWVTLLNAKANFHKGYAQYLQARLVKASGGGEGEVFVGKFGLELGFLRGAISHLSQAEAGLVSLAWGISKLSDSDAEFVKRFRAEVSAILAEAKIVAEPAEKDNSMIYFETVPKDEDLPTVPAAILAKSDQSALAAFLSSYPSSKIIFADIPSLRTLKIQEKYDTCFTERIQPVLDSATEATAKCLETLAAWDLPLAVEMARLSNAEFVTKIMNNGSLLGSESSGAREMESIMREIAGRRDSTRISLQEAVSALDAEETEDSEMRMAFGIGKWTRLSSKDLNKGLRTAAASYLEKLEAANKSDEIVAQKVQANWERITTFVSSENNTKQILVERLNLVGNEDFSKNEILIKLQGALTLLNEILEKRKSAFAQIEDARKSAVGRCAEANRSGVDETHFIENDLKSLNSLISSIEASLKSQESVMMLVSQRNKTFSDWKKATELFCKRDQMAKDLALAKSAYEEIMSNLHVGLNFYSDFGEFIQKFVVNCQDFCLTRSFEKKELLDALQTNSAKQPPLWDGNVKFAFNPNPPQSTPPPFRRNP